MQRDVRIPLAWHPFNQRKSSIATQDVLDLIARHSAPGILGMDGADAETELAYIAGFKMIRAFDLIGFADFKRVGSAIHLRDGELITPGKKSCADCKFHNMRQCRYRRMRNQ